MNENKNETFFTRQLYLDEYLLNKLLNKKRYLGSFYEKLLQMTNDQYTFVFIGMTGTGKSTIIEFLINILMGNVYNDEKIRFNDYVILDNEIQTMGKSKTQQSVVYDIIITYKDMKKLITLIDTPGLSDTGGMEKDEENILKITNILSCYQKINGVFYILPSSLTRQTIDLIHSLCKTFSILPKQITEILGFIVTFTDDENTASAAIKIINDVLKLENKIKVFCLNNPWAEYKNKKTKNFEEKANIVSYSAKTNIESVAVEKAKIFLNYLMFEFIFQNKNYKLSGIKQIKEIRQKLVNLLIKISECTSTIIKNMGLIGIDVRDMNGVESFEKLLEKYSKTTNSILKDGLIMKREHIATKQHNTICEEPTCRQPFCHESCNLNYTPIRGDNIFNACHCSDNKGNCTMCKHELKWHIHTNYKIKLTADKMISDSLKKIYEDVNNKLQISEKFKNELDNKFSEISNYIIDFKKLAVEFETLSIYNDIENILKVNLQKIMKEIDLMKEMGVTEEKIKPLVELSDTINQALNSMVLLKQKKDNDLMKQFKDSYHLMLVKLSDMTIVLKQNMF